MPIKIAYRLHPFCHLPGTTCLIPGSDWQIQVFPTLFKFKNLISQEEKRFSLDVEGPVRDFTVHMNLEKLRVEISGHTARGYRRYLVNLDKAGILINLEKEKMTEIVPVFFKAGPLSCERLSLGSHKQLDWELVCRRLDLKEIFPVWLRLGQITPTTEPTYEGVASLLKECSKLDVITHFTKLFLAGFKSMLTPRLFDDAYQGIVACAHIPDTSSLILLTQGAKLIRSLFFQEAGDTFSFLPVLSPDFHEGKFVDVMTEAGDRISFEWSKKFLKTVEIFPNKTRDVTLSLQKSIKSFRLRHSLKEKGKKCQAYLSVTLQQGKMLYLDRFEA